MENFDITDPSLTQDTVVTDVGSGDGATAVETGTEPSIPLSKLKETLGKDFSDPETALKSIKDTYSYVGKAGQEKAALEQKLKDTGNFVSKDQYETDMFYKDNPNLAASRDLIDSVAKAKGVSVREAVNDPSLKSTLEKVQGYEEVQKSKSVLQSNPRIAASTDKLSKARDLASAGKSDEAGYLAAAAVLEAYEA